MSEFSRRVALINEQGLHMRPMKQIVLEAGKFAAEVTIMNAETEEEADARSPIEMMMLVAPKGTELVVTADGEDAQELVDAICGLVESGFGEE